MHTQQSVLKNPFNIETHKKTFINYLEVIIDANGIIMYAVPSHQEKLIRLCCEKLRIDREDLNRLCPVEYYCDFLTWLCKMSDCIAVWNNFYCGDLNDEQLATLKTLRNNGLYKGFLE